MPVRSLNSSVFKWPNRNQVDRAVREWARDEVGRHPGVIGLGYFGSYARGDWGVGSDLDLVVIIDHSDDPFERRSSSWNLNPLPVPADLLVYTREEWQALVEQRGRFASTLEQETVWVISETDDVTAGA
jgi:uncharacterized protein